MGRRTPLPRGGMKCNTSRQRSETVGWNWHGRTVRPASRHLRRLDWNFQKRGTHGATIYPNRRTWERSILVLFHPYRRVGRSFTSLTLRVSIKFSRAKYITTSVKFGTSCLTAIDARSDSHVLIVGEASKIGAFFFHRSNLLRDGHDPPLP